MVVMRHEESARQFQLPGQKIVFQQDSAIHRAIVQMTHFVKLVLTPNTSG